MGLAATTSVTTGVMGIGYPANEVASTQYPSLLELMANQGLITTKAYSLYLDSITSSSGTILFGGVDTAKYTKPLIALPVAATSGTYTEFNIGLTGLNVTFSSGNTTSFTPSNYAIPVLLDSGTTMTYLPSTETSTLFTALNAVDDTQGSGKVYIDCGIRTQYPRMTFNFAFSSVVIRVPVSELIFSTDISKHPRLPFTDICGFGIHPSPTVGRNLLGDTFLRSAYVVYDLENNQIGLAQTSFDTRAENVVDFVKGSGVIPGATQVQGVSVTPSVKALPGVGTSVGADPTGGQSMAGKEVGKSTAGEKSYSSGAEKGVGREGVAGKGLGTGVWGMVGFLVGCLILA